MDPTKEKTDLETLLESTDTSMLNNSGAVSGSYGYEAGYGPTPPHSYGDDTITISSSSSNWSNNNNIVGGGFAYPNTVSVTSGSYTIGGAGT